jgi:Tfp pilus assembly protein PilO
VHVKMKNMAVAGLVVLLVGMLWYRVVYSPMTSKASKAKTAAHDADAQSANLSQALKGTGPSAAKKQAASDRSTLAALPTDPAEAAFFRSLDALHVSSGASWQAVTNGVPAPSGDFTTITVSLTAQGTETQIAAFMDGLSAMPRLFLVDNVTLSPAGAGAPGSAAPVVHPGALFRGDSEHLTISGRIFSSSAGAASATAASSGGSTTPATGATAPAGAPAPTGTVNG